MFVGIDIGSQSLKAVVLDRAGKRVGSGSQSYSYDTPRPGWAQQDPALWDGALRPAIEAALAGADTPAESIEAVCVVGQLDGCVAVDRDGGAIGPCLIWMDRRATDTMPASLPDDFTARTGVVADPGHFAAKVSWLKRKAMGMGGARFHQPVSYTVERLTGAAVWDHGLASTSMLYDLGTRDYADDLLRIFDIERAQLPAIAPAADVAGSLSAAGAELTGLVEGTPVAVGTGDDFSSVLGAGVIAPGRLAVVLGTAEVVGALSSAFVVDDDGLVETHGYPIGRSHFVENPGWLCGGAVEWVRKLVGAKSAAELDVLAAAAPAGCDGLNFVPALTGAMAPRWIPAMRGCFHGLSPSHGPGHLCRAVLEGCAFAMRDVRDRIDALTGDSLGAIVIVGGGANSALWAQMRSDVAQLPVGVPAIVDTSPIGAAMLASQAGGGPTAAELATALDRSSRTYEPNHELADRYRSAHDRYRSLFDALSTLTP